MTETEERPQRKPDDNVIFMGGKPFMNYVNAVVMQFTARGAREVVLKARGKFISRAVDVAEVVRNRILKDKGIGVKKIDISSEGFEKTGDDGRVRNVSVSIIEITLARKI
jgi:DNA-binding protein